MTTVAFAQRIFDDINQHTQRGDGVTRPSYSAEETVAMRVVERYAKDFGLKTEWDVVGNLHCVLPGNAPGKEIVTGSHLDTVPHGGRYDGVAGVVAGLLAIVRFTADGRLQRPPLRLIVFRGEESAWFGKCYLGSLGLFGRLTKEDFDRRSVQTGERLSFHIAQCGNWKISDERRIVIGEKLLDPASVDRFIEVHIEQGPVLHEAGVPVGIVDSISGNYRYRGAQIVGEAGHSGTTPTRLRKDAVLAFADLMHRLEQGTKAFGDDVVMTSGVAGTDPTKHATTIIPDVVNFDLEFRSGHPDTLELFDTFWRATATAVEAQRVLNAVKLGTKTVTAPAAMDPLVRRALLRAAHLTLDTEDPMHLPSGAGHDAAVFAAEGIPTGMIFIRNEHGSHNPRESMRMDDFVLATGVLYRAMGGL